MKRLVGSAKSVINITATMKRNLIMKSLVGSTKHIIIVSLNLDAHIKKSLVLDAMSADTMRKTKAVAQMTMSKSNQGPILAKSAAQGIMMMM